MKTNALTSADPIQSQIKVLRGLRVLLDSDLAALYGVQNKRLNEQVLRNRGRFPNEFCFQLTREELTNLKSQFATSSSQHGGIRKLPYVFTEHGALMAATVLNSPRAIQMSIHVIRAFVEMRSLFAAHRALAAKLGAIEARLGEHDEDLKSLSKLIQGLRNPPAPENPRKIGFHQGDR